MPDLPEILKRVLCFVEPINLNRRGIIPGLFMCEAKSLAFQGEVRGLYTKFSQYDDGRDYDNPEIYDNSNPQTIIFGNNSQINTQTLGIILRDLAGVDNHINYIRLYKSGFLVKTYPLTSYSYPAYNIVDFKFKISDSELFSDVDKVGLFSSFGGELISTNLTVLINKDVNQELELTYRFKIEDCLGYDDSSEPLEIEFMLISWDGISPPSTSQIFFEGTGIIQIAYRGAMVGDEGSFTTTHPWSQEFGLAREIGEGTTHYFYFSNRSKVTGFELKNSSPMTGFVLPENWQKFPNLGYFRIYGTSGNDFTYLPPLPASCLDIDFRNNKLDAAAISTFLIHINSWETHNGVIKGENQFPSAPLTPGSPGDLARLELLSRGWIITLD